MNGEQFDAGHATQHEVLTTVKYDGDREPD